MCLRACGSCILRWRWQHRDSKIAVVFFVFAVSVMRFGFGADKSLRAEERTFGLVGPGENANCVPMPMVQCNVCSAKVRARMRVYGPGTFEAAV